MAHALAEPVLAGNRLLAILDRAEFDRLQPHLEPFPLEQGATLFHADDPIDHVYFPDHGLISHAAHVGDGIIAEAGLVGKEGLIGVPALLGSGRASFHALVQVPGEARRMPAEVFRAEVERCSDLARLAFRFLEALLTHLGQSSACNSHHTVEQRCCRWLLLTCDRLECNEFPLTQQYLAVMLGVRRQGVTEVAGQLARAGLIRYRRGKVTLLDRPGLETKACHCYHAIRSRYEDLFAAPR